jgi:hypothetical protein
LINFPSHRNPRRVPIEIAADTVASQSTNLPLAMVRGSVMQQHDENDERNRNSEKPKQNGHRDLSFR